MIPRCGRIVTRCGREGSRTYASVAGASYSSKVRAYKFAVSAAEATGYVAPIVSLLSLFRIQNPLSALAARYLPWSGIQPKYPHKIGAFYVPVWAIDAAVEAKAWLTRRGEEESKQTLVTAIFQNSCMPGLAYDPISQMSFKDSAVVSHPRVFEHTAVPWTNSLRNQLGSQVECLPFTLTPFALQDAARELSYQRAVIDEDFRIDPTSVAARFIAAYPILMPIYLMQYQVPVLDDTLVDLTVVVDASRRRGRVIATNLLKDAKNVAKELTGKDVSVGSSGTGLWAEAARAVEHMDLFQFNSGSILPSAQMQFAFMDGLCSVSREKERSSDLEFWINRMASSPGMMAKYQSLERDLRKAATGSDQIDWKDPRIREYTDKEVAAVMVYQKARKDFLNLKHIHDMVQGVSGPVLTINMSHPKHQRDQDGVRSGLHWDSAEKFTDSISEGMKKAQAILRQSTPEWQKRWESQTTKERTEEAQGKAQKDANAGNDRD